MRKPGVSQDLSHCEHTSSRQRSQQRPRRMSGLPISTAAPACQSSSAAIGNSQDNKRRPEPGGLNRSLPGRTRAALEEVAGAPHEPSLTPNPIFRCSTRPRAPCARSAWGSSHRVA